MSARIIQEVLEKKGIYPVPPGDNPDAAMRRLVEQGRAPILVTRDDGKVQFMIVYQKGSGKLYEALHRMMRNATTPEPEPPAWDGHREKSLFWGSLSPDDAQQQIFFDERTRAQVEKITAIFRDIGQNQGLAREEELVALRVRLADDGIAVGLNHEDTRRNYTLFKDSGVRWRHGGRKPLLVVKQDGQPFSLLVDDTSELYPFLEQALSLTPRAPAALKPAALKHVGRGSVTLSDIEGRQISLELVMSHANDVQRIFSQVETINRDLSRT